MLPYGTFPIFGKPEKADLPMCRLQTIATLHISVESVSLYDLNLYLAYNTALRQPWPRTRPLLKATPLGVIRL